jgi:site-specific recombinase XerD
MSKSMLTERKSLPYNHHLQPFLTFLKLERGFADATIVNRERSLNPFLGWLVAQDVPLSTVSPVTITKYFTNAVAGRWKRTTISFHVYSLRSFFRYASSRGWCAAGIAESIDAPQGVPFKRTGKNPLTYLEKAEIDALLASPDRYTQQGRKDHALLLFLYNSGARASEAAGVKISDLDGITDAAVR